jgi:hypothetical protein
MRSVKTFNENNVEAMIDYLIFVSTPSERLLSAPMMHPHVHHQYHLPPRQSAIHTALRARLPAMSPLHRESLPVLPHMCDEARDLAAIASAVVRNVRMPKEPEAGREWGRERDVGPMDEALEGELDEGCGNRIPGSSSDATEGEVEELSEAQLDVVRFIKACFDVEAEAMRRVAPRGVAKKKNPRRRRRPNKLDEGLVRLGEERLSASAGMATSASAGASTPSVEAQSLEGPEAENMPSPLATPLSMTSSGYGSLPVLVGDLSSKPEIMRQMSHTAVSETLPPGSKRRKGVFRFMTGSRK